MEQGIKIISEEEFNKAKENINKSLNRDIGRLKHSEDTINWEESTSLVNCWKEAKQKCETLIKKEDKMFFIASSNVKISGKPQLIYQTKQRISLIKKLVLQYKEEVEDIDGSTHIETKEFSKYKFIDDKLDRKEEKSVKEDYCLNFWVYRLVNQEYEYYLFSEDRIDEVSMIIQGMEVPVQDLSELNTNLKLKRISRIFFVKSVEKDVRLLPKEELINFSKEMKEKHLWDKEGFMNFVFTDENEKQYNYSEEFKLLRISQLLSGKYEGYPLHMMKIGPVGTGKTTEAETLAWKFNEDEGILEAGNSTFKALVPSFKEKPANLGFIAKCNRAAIIDELMKMVQKSLRDGNGDHNIYFGELNMLLEHKERKIGSGNDNSIKLKNQSKIFITTNPLEKRYNLAQHLSYIDNSTLSRVLIWIQDWEEVNKIYSKNDIKENKIFVKPNNYTKKSTNTDTYTKNILYNNFSICSWTFSKEELSNDFLTIYDSCNDFVVNFDLERIKSIFQSSCNEVKQELKPIWSSRGLHHSVLILDGLVKYRCLFEEYDKEFTPKDEDYLKLEVIIKKMLKNWETQFQNNNLLN